MDFKGIFSDLLPYIGAAAGTMIAPGVGTSIGYGLGQAGGTALKGKQKTPSLEMASPDGGGMFGKADYLSDDELARQNGTVGSSGGFDIGKIFGMLGKGGGSPLDMISGVAGGMQSGTSPNQDDYFGGKTQPMVGNLTPFTPPKSILEQLKMQRMYR